jgi:hypothetical protein
MAWTVIVSACITARVRRKRFALLRDARAFADRYRPCGRRPSKGLGYRTEVVRR